MNRRAVTFFEGPTRAIQSRLSAPEIEETIHAKSENTRQPKPT